MAATTINSYSDAIEDLVTSASNQLEPAEGGAKRRTAFFKVTLASQAAGEDIAVAIIPKGATIVGGILTVSATLANSAQLSVGLADKAGSGYIDAANSVSDNVAYLKAAAVPTTTTVATPAANVIAATQALGFGYKTEKELWLTITTSVGTVSTETVYGYIDYLID